LFLGKSLEKVVESPLPITDASRCVMRRASTAVDLLKTWRQNIIGERADMLRADLPKFEAAMAQLQKSPFVAKRGQRWESTQDKVDEYLARIEELSLSQSSRGFNF
jgi:hypothetical protein